MDTEHLRSALALAETGSFYRASKVTGFAPSGLKYQLDKLEAQLGFRLFERSHEGLAPTPDGERFIAFARRMVADLDAEVTSIRSDADKPRIRILYNAPQINDSVYPRIYAQYRTMHPHVSCSLVETEQMTRADSESVLLGRIDQTITGTRPHLLARVPVFAYFSIDHPLNNLPAVAPEDLDAYPLALPDPFYLARMSKELRDHFENRSEGIRYVRDVRAYAALISECMFSKLVVVTIGRNRAVDGPLQSVQFTGQTCDYNIYLSSNAREHVLEYVRFLQAEYTKLDGHVW